MKTATYTPLYDKTAKGCPKRTEQLNALVNNTYWTVLDCDLFDCKEIHEEPILRFAVNSLKHRLQVYGPYDHRTTHDRRPNLGAAQGSIFHHHVKGSAKTTYVIEWGIVDIPNKILAIVGFAKHENYPYQQRPLSTNDVNNLLNQKSSQEILRKVLVLKQQARNKISRLETGMSKKEFRSRNFN